MPEWTNSLEERFLEELAHRIRSEMARDGELPDWQAQQELRDRAIQIAQEILREWFDAGDLGEEEKEMLEEKIPDFLDILAEQWEEWGSWEEAYYSEERMEEEDEEEVSWELEE